MEEKLGDLEASSLYALRTMDEDWMAFTYYILSEASNYCIECTARTARVSHPLSHRPNVERKGEKIRKARDL